MGWLARGDDWSVEEIDMYSMKCLESEVDDCKKLVQRQREFIEKLEYCSAAMLYPDCNFTLGVAFMS